VDVSYKNDLKLFFFFIFLGRNDLIELVELGAFSRPQAATQQKQLLKMLMM
jgi:hypothetical protein